MKSRGFTVVEVAITVVMIAVLSFAGWRYYDSHHQTVATPALSDTTVPSAPVIKATADLDKALAALDGVNLEAGNSSDSEQLDSMLSQF